MSCIFMDEILAKRKLFAGMYVAIIYVTIGTLGEAVGLQNPLRQAKFIKLRWCRHDYFKGFTRLTLRPKTALKSAEN